MIYIELIERFHEDIMRRQGLAQKKPEDLSGRIAKLKEELQEFEEAETELEQFSELTDLLYVVLGTAEVMEWPVFQAIEEIHRANMTKEFHPIRPVKGDNFKPANLAYMLSQSKIAKKPNQFIDQSMQGRKRRAENRRRMEESLRESLSKGPENQRLEKRDDEGASDSNSQS